MKNQNEIYHNPDRLEPVLVIALGLIAIVFVIV